MKLEIQCLEIQNFKGIKKLKIPFHGRTVIKGANATGKTTVYDAYLWLLFDKDSTGRKAFSVKPLNPDGSEKHHLRTSVEGVFKVDDEELKIKKVFSEKWTKKRGTILETFTGHTTDYYWQDVPLKKGEYENKVSKILPANTLKVLSNPFYFASQLNTVERRELLMEIVGDVNVNDVLCGHPELIELSPLLDDYTIEEIIKMRKASASKINKEMAEIPVRIDELESSKKEVDVKTLQAKKKAIQSDLDVLRGSGKLGEATIQKMQSLSDSLYKLSDERSDILTAHDNRVRKKKLERQAEMDELDQCLKKLERDLKDKNEEIRKSSAKKSELDKQLESLRGKAQATFALEFDPEKNCPICGQPLPIEKVREQMENFRHQKVIKLQNLKVDGESIKAKIEIEETYVRQTREDISGIEKTIKDFKKRSDLLKTKKVEEEPLSEQEQKRLNAIEKDQKRIKEELKGLDAAVPKDFDAKIEAKEEELEAVEFELGAVKRNQEIDRKIKDYEAKEAKFGKEYEENQRILYLCESYARVKMNLVSEGLNEKFKFVRWKLFDEQINGGIKDVCQATVEGVPFEDANNAAKINAGLDIINTLSLYMRTSVPIFVDNAETVNSLISTEGQLIELFVTDDPQLRVEEEEVTL